MSNRSTAHATFVIERDYDAAPARVFSAWASLEAKNQWFGPDGGGEDHVLDFREGGREHFEAGGGGDVYLYDALYEDIVPDERIVYTYNMHRNGVRMSVSVSTVELLAAGERTHLRYTEQGAFLDGQDTPAAREHGTREILDKLAGALAQGTLAR
ncbi:MAG TPA: SRPBCC family protein [Solirubrobacteraceae bacterium]|nr:SRPBCC family protein [Solirubrobacteraceae bacterium]